MMETMLRRTTALSIFVAIVAVSCGSGPSTHADAGAYARRHVDRRRNTDAAAEAQDDTRATVYADASTRRRQRD